MPSAVLIGEIIMKKLIVLMTVTGFMLSAFASCGETDNSSSETVSEIVTEAEITEEATEEATTEEAVETSEKSDGVAGEGDTVAPETVGFEGMTAIYGDSLNNGEYTIFVDSSSSMFKIVDCTLYVADGELSAKLTMSGTGYGMLFMGTGEEAVNSDESEFIPYAEENEQYTFTVPVSALDEIIDCAAYSKKKEKWYDRQLVFRADSLPIDAFAEGTVNTADTLSIEDGEYTIEVSLEGGSGKATVQTPAKLTVTDGQPTAEIIWSSKNYDYMVVDGEKYYSEIIDERSVFEIPVLGFDFKIPVSADTTAMSTPHEIEYTLYFDSATLEQISE